MSYGTTARWSIATTTAILVLAGACGLADDSDAVPETAAPQAAGAEPGVVDIVAQDLIFIAPDTISPGWTTFRFTNAAPMIHFAVVERMPEGIGAAEQQELVAPIFQEGLDLLVEGDVDAAMARFGALPPWFGEIAFLGGPGFTSPGEVSEATVYLEPGTYLLECYVKTDGIFHSYNPNPEMYGMVHEFAVVGSDTGTPEPTASMHLTISSENGIVMEGAARPGEHTIGVHFEDQTVHENFVGHDVHLVRLTADVDLTELERWMDWSQPDGLNSPAPAHFLGGLNEMPAGTTGYFTVVLDPGEYAWIAEVPAAREKAMLIPFTVEGG
ncbi:MAG: hypothetical protein WEA09_09330 [Gemmatimonadota bacterium]